MSRISALSLQSIYRKKCQYNFNLLLHFGSKHYSTLPSVGTLNADRLKKIEFPKYVQPLVNHSIDEILSIVNHEFISPVEIISVLKALRMQILFNNIDSNTFKSDKKFELLCEIYEHNCATLRPAMLVSGLRSLLEVGVSPTSSCILSAEETIIKNIGLFPTFSIISCLYFHHKYMETSLQKQAVSVLITELAKRAYEISTPAEVLMLIHFLQIFNEDDRKEMQQKILELIPELSTNELCKMLSTLSESSNRNIDILNAITFNFQMKMDVINMKEVLDILYSFKKLNFYDSKFLSYLMDKVVPEIPKVKQSSIVSGFLTTCGHLRWKHPDLLKECGEWICKHLDSCRPKEFVSYILAVATLNHNGIETQKVVKTILPFLSLQKIESPDIWLDTVWSLAILNFVDKEMLLEVLSPDFYKLLISDSDFRTVTNKLKLMNLKAVLKMHYPECIFGCDLFLESSEVPQSLETANSRKHVITVLNNFLPSKKYMCTSQNTDMGIFIDAEFIMDKNIKPLPLSNFGLLSSTISAKLLSEGSQRIALLIMFYKDYTLCNKSITGCNVLATQLLSSQGYTVVRVPFHEFIKNSTEVMKAKYLLSKITTAMNKNEAKLSD